jgi:hypothetical protein
VDPIDVEVGVAQQDDKELVRVLPRHRLRNIIFFPDLLAMRPLLRAV